MKILILGAKGFIGSNALRHFRQTNSETYGCDITPPVEYDSKFFLLDRDHPEFDKLFIQNTFDICINASGSGSVSYSIERPDEDYRLNAKNVFDILNAISLFNSNCRFLNFSSAAVYGNPTMLPVSESDSTKPVSPYGFHKLISEQICSEFYHIHHIKTCSLRVFSAYGEGLRKQLFWDIYQKSLKSSEVELFGTGEETRDFIHILDLLKAIDCILEKSSFNADVVNVASGKSVSIREAAETFGKFIGKKIDIIFNNQTKEGDPKKWLADINKIKSFNFFPAIELEKGLSLYAEWIRNSAGKI